MGKVVGQWALRVGALYYCEFYYSLCKALGNRGDFIGKFVGYSTWVKENWVCRPKFEILADVRDRITVNGGSTTYLDESRQLFTFTEIDPGDLLLYISMPYKSEKFSSLMKGELVAR